LFLDPPINTDGPSRVMANGQSAAFRAVLLRNVQT
jgi:hypothetical protein